MKTTKAELVEKAQQLISWGIDLLEVAIEGDAEARDYVLNHLKILNSSKHDFLSNDLNLDNLIERYSDEGEIELPSDLKEIFEII